MVKTGDEVEEDFSFDEADDETSDEADDLIDEVEVLGDEEQGINK